MKVKVKLVSLNVKTKIVAKCITIQRNQKYLRQASQHSPGLPVGYINRGFHIVLLFVRVFLSRLQIWFLRDLSLSHFHDF